MRDDRLVLERDPGYWGGAIDVARVVFRPIPDVGARVAALLRGEVDVLVGLPPDHVERVARHPSTRVEEALYAGQYVLVVESRRPPLDHPKMKQALSLAIDRGALLRSMWLGRGTIPDGPIPRGEIHHDPYPLRRVWVTGLGVDGIP